MNHINIKTHVEDIHSRKAIKLSKCLCNYENVQPRGSSHSVVTNFCDKTSYCLVNRGPDAASMQGLIANADSTVYIDI